MPIDKMMLDATLGTFKNMVEECKQKNLSGENFDKMCEVYARMEQLGQEHSDMNEFNAQIMNENLYGKFSDFYGRVLSGEAAQSQASDSGSYDDSALLKQSVDALKQAVESIKKNYQDAIEKSKGNDVPDQNKQGLDYLERNTEKGFFSATGGMESLRKESEESYKKNLDETPAYYDNSVEVEILSNPDDLIKPILDLISLGEQEGMTLPKFLRLQIEKGLDKAMEGSVTTKKSLETEREFLVASYHNPHQLKIIETKIKKYDELCSQSKFGVPNWTQYKFSMQEIEREFELDSIKWERIKHYWEKLISDLSFWSLSYCQYAPGMKPWVLSKNPVEATINTQKTAPGLFVEYEKLFKKYFNLSFLDIFKHETFLWDVKNNFLGDSQEFIEYLIEQVYPQCKPFNDLNSEAIELREKFYKESLESNPDIYLSTERFINFYDNKFGAGRYKSKFGEPERIKTNAKPWNLDNFKYCK